MVTYNPVIAMKRLFYLYTLLLLLVGCTEEVSMVDTPSLADEEFYATIEDADIDEQIRMRWTAEDCINLFEKTTYSREYMFTGKTGANAGGFKQVSTDDKYWQGVDVDYNYAVYPHSADAQLDESGYFLLTMPSEQAYAENSFGLGANTMVAVSAGKQLNFKNVCGYLRVRLYGKGVSVSSITLTSNGGEAIAGAAKVTATLDGGPTCEMTGSGKSIRLVCPNPVTISTDANAPTDFWIVVPPVKLSKGFSVTVEDGAGNTQVFDVPQSFTFGRNVYYNLQREVNVLSSGSGDDGAETGGIVGKWYATYVEVSSVFEVEDGMIVGDWMVFNADNTCTWTERGVKLNAQYEIKDNTLSLFNGPDGYLPYSYDIVKLTSTELVLTTDMGGWLEAKFEFERASSSGDDEDGSTDGEDGEDVSNSYISVNGENCDISDASCSFHGTIVDDLGEFEIPPHASFTMHLVYDETFYWFSLNVDGASSSDVINLNENLVTDGNVDVDSFRMFSSFELSTRYYDEDGKLSIVEKGSNYVVVKFDNFSFIKDMGNSETKYVINGKVKFSDINEE